MQAVCRQYARGKSVREYRSCVEQDAITEPGLMLDPRWSRRSGCTRCRRH